MKAFLLCTALAGALLAASAKADVQMCNKTRRPISLAIAGIINVPYTTWSAAGWWNLSPGRCANVMTGNQAGLKIYYYGIFLDNGRDWNSAGAASYAPVCVPADRRAFQRSGSPQLLQSCPRGWIKKPFYETYTRKRDRRINLYD